jgi:hypothetical protein
MRTEGGEDGKREYFAVVFDRMNDNLSIALKDMIFNQTETYDGRDHGYIRWGYIEGADGEQRGVAFFANIPAAQAAHMAGKDLLIESNRVVSQESVLNGAKYQAFEWLNTEFVAVNAEEQTWFRFN